MAESDRPLHDLVNAALRDWRQGDCVLGEQWFLFRSDPASPLTPEAVEATAEGDDAVETGVLGLMVVTQSCDVVRSCRDRPFVEVCPLVEVDKSDLLQIERGRLPHYAYIPRVAEAHLVADLDRVMTVEKSVLMKWEHVAGCANDLQRRDLQLAIARKRSRAALPDEFVALAKKLQDRLKKKHGKKESPEGRALRALREIRVRAAPSWFGSSTASAHSPRRRSGWSSSAPLRTPGARRVPVGPLQLRVPGEPAERLPGVRHRQRDARCRRHPLRALGAAQE